MAETALPEPSTSKTATNNNNSNRSRSRVTPTNISTTQYDVVSLKKHQQIGDLLSGRKQQQQQGGWRNGGCYPAGVKLLRVNGGRFHGGLGSGPSSGSGSNQKVNSGCGDDGNGDGDGGGDDGDNVDGLKFGRVICDGHKNYELIVDLQLGIRYTLGKYSSTSRELKSYDFDPKEKFWTRFPPEGSKSTPTHKSTAFRWKDYCPWVFRYLRDLFGVDPAEYMMAVCGNDALRELSSPGKSGSFFYLTQDDKFMIKTVKKSEVKVLLRMLPSYYQHVCTYENSLVTKFYGVHCVKPAGGPKTRFIVMGNLFCSKHRIHRRFDLKGSRHGRTIEKSECEIDETTTLKDLDLDFVFRLQKNHYQELIEQVERDCEFLGAERIMDYSLLIGMHFVHNKTEEKGSSRNEYLHDQPFLEADLQDFDRVLDFRKPTLRLGDSTPARAERLSSGNSEIYEVILFYGIIDILQDYDMSKRLEHVYKSLQVDPTSISAVDPKSYSRRFREFIAQIFVEDK